MEEHHLPPPNLFPPSPQEEILKIGNKKDNATPTPEKGQLKSPGETHTIQYDGKNLDSPQHQIVELSKIPFEQTKGDLNAPQHKIDPKAIDTQKTNETFKDIFVEILPPPPKSDKSTFEQLPLKPPPKPSPLKTPFIALDPKAILEDKIEVATTGKEMKTPVFSSEAAMIGYLLRSEDESLKDLDIPSTRNIILSEFRAYMSPQQLIMGYVSASFEKNVPHDDILKNTVALAKEAGITGKDLQRAFETFNPSSGKPMINSCFDSEQKAQMWTENTVSTFADRPISKSTPIRENLKPTPLPTKGNFLKGNIDKIANDIFVINAQHLMNIDMTKNLTSPDPNKPNEDLDNHELTKMTKNFDSMANLLIQNIITQGTPKERAQALSDTIKLADKLVELGDLNGAMMIVSGVLEGANIF